MTEPMRSWVDGFLTDCEEYPQLIGNGDPDDSYSPEEVVRAVRWLADRYDTLTARLDALETAGRRYLNHDTCVCGHPLVDHQSGFGCWADDCECLEFDNEDDAEAKP